MGKSNSKLKPEVVEELTRKTYCTRASLRTAPAGSWMPLASRRSTSSSSHLETPPSSPRLFSTSSTRTRMAGLSSPSSSRHCR
uniref:Neuronal calcium sensor 1 n=1 Tax=Mus musculus TaxID=10090 RepID=A0A0A6YY43_MOUSE